MNIKKQIEKEVNATMDLFETIGQIEPDPYYNTKLRKKLIENKQKGFFNFQFLLNRLRLAPILLIVIIIINIISIILFLTNTNSKIELEKNSKYYSSIFQSDYSIDQNNYALNISKNSSMGEQ